MQINATCGLPKIYTHFYFNYKFLNTTTIITIIKKREKKMRELPHWRRVRASPDSIWNPYLSPSWSLHSHLSISTHREHEDLFFIDHHSHLKPTHTPHQNLPHTTMSSHPITLNITTLHLTHLYHSATHGSVVFGSIRVFYILGIFVPYKLWIVSFKT